VRLQIGPAHFGPAVGTSHPGGGPGTDPAVERLVALPELLPFEWVNPRLVFTVMSCFATNCFGHSLSTQSGRCTVPAGTIHRLRALPLLAGEAEHQRLGPGAVD
jgi:hypothetical protein